MLRDRKIAVFIDVDNTGLDFSQYDSAMQQIRTMGEIVCATVYGAGERKQKQVIDSARENGFTIQLPARNRKRVRKVFDDRIWVDATDLVAHNANVDTIAIVALPTDMVYFFSYLRRLGLQVIGCDNLDEASLALVSGTVSLAEGATSKAPKVQVVGEEHADDENQTVALLKEIEKLRNDYDTAKPAATTAAQKPTATLGAQNTSQNDLVSKIEEVRKNNSTDDSDDLVEEIKKLLDGLD